MSSELKKEEVKLETKMEKGVEYVNATFDPSGNLLFYKLNTTYKVVRKVVNKKHNPLVSKKLVKSEREEISVKMREITVEELREIRKKNIPSLVYKNEEGKIIYTEIPDNLTDIVIKMQRHMCAEICAHMSAAPDEKGGCAKVRAKSTGIERFPWITGYETFGTKRDLFVVCDCKHYEKCKPKEARPVKDQIANRIALAQYIWPDVTSLAEVRRRKHKTR